MTSPDIFISYRRLDSGFFSPWLASRLRAKFGEDSVFIDVRNIRDADIWTSEIEKSLQSARLVIVVMGKTWLSTANDVGRRRIDLADDWVRREIEMSLQMRKKICRY